MTQDSRLEGASWIEEGNWLRLVVMATVTEAETVNKDQGKGNEEEKPT